MNFVTVVVDAVEIEKEIKARAGFFRVVGLDVEFWKKFSIPFACIVFVLIGVPIGVRYKQGGVSMVVQNNVRINGKKVTLRLGDVVVLDEVGERRDYVL